jgi:hypothetical protein
MPHPRYGLPNPNYLLLHPGSLPSWHWADQFRRYFPVFYPDISQAIGNCQSRNPVYLSTGEAGCAPDPQFKLIDSDVLDTWVANTDDNPVDSLTHAPVRTMMPVPKGTFGTAPLNPTSSSCAQVNINGPTFVPNISKDDAWRITRIGRKYQEIIADAIMSYQMNPWWPNPCAQLQQVAVPLSMQSYIEKDPTTGQYLHVNPTANPGNVGNWYSWQESAITVASGNLNMMYSQIPDYYAYYNRFWCRAASTYNPNPGMQAGVNWGQQYSSLPSVGSYQNLVNANGVENLGMYPQSFQYFGLTPLPGGQAHGGPWDQILNTNPGPASPVVPAGAFTTSGGCLFADRIMDFPYNTLEDALGCDWRYLSNCTPIMAEYGDPNFSTSAGGITYANLRNAPARNHPFRNWADFVAMLGHLVYRSPMPPVAATNSAFWPAQGIAQMSPGNLSAQHNYLLGHRLRDPVLGVNAGNAGYPQVCPAHFFDGSAIQNADSLQGANCGAYQIVAATGFWPISANYGAFPQQNNGQVTNPIEVMLYPLQVAPWTGGGAVQAEWERRIDEWRGRDASGLRVEQNYISEEAANDVLVCLSNGLIPPIDFDGDGHVSMTLKSELPPDQNYNGTVLRFWPGYPWHNFSGATSGVQSLSPTGAIEAQKKPGFTNIPSAFNYDSANQFYNSTVTGTPVTHSNYGVKGYCPDLTPPPNLYDPGFGSTDVVNYITPWYPVDQSEVLQGCVTMPIKFRSNTFRVTVVAMLTDSNYQTIYSTRRYQRVYSRVPQNYTTTPGSAYSGNFVLHESHIWGGADPVMNFTGMK